MVLDLPLGFVSRVDKVSGRTWRNHGDTYGLEVIWMSRMDATRLPNISAARVALPSLTTGLVTKQVCVVFV